MAFSQEFNVIVTQDVARWFSQETAVQVQQAPSHSFSVEPVARLLQDAARSFSLEPDATFTAEAIATSSLYDDAVTAVSTQGDIVGGQVRNDTLSEEHLQAVVALWVEDARLSGVTSSQSRVVPADRPELEEVIRWRAMATATIAGMFEVSLGTDRLFGATLTAGERIVVEGRITRLTTSTAPCAVTDARAYRSSGAFAFYRGLSLVLSSSRTLLASMPGGVVHRLDVRHAGRAP